MATEFTRGWRIGVALGLVACLALLVLPADSPAWVSVARGASLIATGVFLVAAARMPRGVRAVWWAMWLYQFLTVAGDIVYDVERYHFGNRAFPGPADVLYLAAYGSALLGLFILIRSVHRGHDREAWIDAMIMTIAAASAVGTFIIAPALAGSDPTDLARYIALAYPLLDLLVLSGLIRLLVGSGAVNPALILLTTSFGLYLTADLTYNYLVSSGQEAFYPGWLEMLFLGAAIAMAAAATGPGATSIMTASKQPQGRTSRWRLVGLAIGALTAPVLLALVAWGEGGWAERLLALTSIAVILLVLWRVRILVATIEEQSEKLGEQARTDALTGLPNRRTWDYEVERVAGATLERRVPLTVAMLDLDHFKDYNDRFGHPVADELLTACARAWSSRLGPPAFLARYGGEEFAVLLPGIGQDEALVLMEDVRRATPGEQTVSIGIAERRPDESVHEAVDRADHALYAAKDSGRNRVTVAA